MPAASTTAVNCSLITLTTDDGVVGVGDAAGPLGVHPRIHQAARPVLRRPEPLRLRHRRRPKFATGSIISASQGHFIAALGGINIAVLRRHRQRRWAFRCTTCSAAGRADRSPATPPPATSPTIRRSASRRSSRAWPTGTFVGVKIKIGAGIASDVERVRDARKTIGDELLLMVDYNGNYTVDVALESMRQIEPFNIHWARSRCRRMTSPATPNCARGRRSGCRRARRIPACTTSSS